jgi:hypothetical protein
MEGPRKFEINGTCLVLLCHGFNLLVERSNAINKNKESILYASKEINVDIKTEEIK